MLEKLAELFITFIECRKKVSQLQADNRALSALCRKYLDKAEAHRQSVELKLRHIDKLDSNILSLLETIRELRLENRKLEDEREVLSLNIRLLTDVNERNIQRIRAETAVAISQSAVPETEEQS